MMAFIENFHTCEHFWWKDRTLVNFFFDFVGAHFISSTVSTIIVSTKRKCKKVFDYTRSIRGWKSGATTWQQPHKASCEKILIRPNEIKGCLGIREADSGQLWVILFTLERLLSFTLHASSNETRISFTFAFNRNYSTNWFRRSQSEREIDWFAICHVTDFQLNASII